MLAICSDLDETPDGGAYLELARYINTREVTSVGQGVGLEVGNTLFFDMAAGSFSYWNATASEREQIRSLIRSGHIDCLHSFGDLTTQRDAIERNLAELDQHGLRLRVWIDHAVAPTNLGPDIMRGHGDLVCDPAYHSDLTLAHGIRYVWLGRVTSCMGQDVPYTADTCLAQRRSIGAAISTARDLAKQVRATLGDHKYALHRGNRLVRNYRLRDGQTVLEFMRCNPNPAGVSRGDNAAEFPEAINPVTLKLLIERGGWTILYTHLGKRLTSPGLFDCATRQAFELLAETERQGEILVTTTRRLLDYHTMCARVGIKYQGDVLNITSNGEDVTGLTLYGLTPHTHCVIDGETRELTINPPDESGQTSRSVAWTRLVWPL